MKAIQSLWTKPWEENKCGWLSFEDILASQELSIILLRRCKQFEKIVFYTDKKGFELTKNLHQYYDEIIVNLDEINWVENYNWAFQKLFIYKQQTKPFVHIDNDVYLWDGLPQHWIDGKVDYFFQSKELIKDFPFYTDGLKEISECTTEDIFPYLPEYAVNCGVAGFIDLSIISVYYENGKTMIERNQKQIWKTFAQKHHQCVLFEQLFLVPLIDGKNIEYILDSSTKEIAGVRYTHLLSLAKRDENNIRRVKAVLNNMKTR